MTENTYYGIEELDPNGRTVGYLRQPSPGYPTIYQLTTNLAEGAVLIGQDYAVEQANVLAAEHPGKGFRVVEHPPGTRPVVPPSPSL
jgi:hypothetical protein